VPHYLGLITWPICLQALAVREKGVITPRFIFEEFLQPRHLVRGRDVLMRNAKVTDEGFKLRTTFRG